VGKLGEFGGETTWKFPGPRLLCISSIIHHSQHIPYSYRINKTTRPIYVELNKMLQTSKNTNKRIQHIFRLVGIVLVLISTRIAQSISTGGSNGLPSKFPLSGIAPDPFVLVSPLIIGVVCKDGVLLIALHSVFSTENGSRNESTLLLKSYNDDDDDDDNQTTKLKSKSKSAGLAVSQKDLPRSYRGPFRIYPLDSSGTTAMVCTGWRTDCQFLANSIRSIDKKEHHVFGNPAISSSNGIEYGSYLACKASLLMAKFCISETRRPLSCLGLLASGTGLWMVDSTGAYRIRAHAVGAGSDQMNIQLRKRDWKNLDCNEAAIDLLQILFDEENEDNDPTATATEHDNDSSSSSETDDTKIKVPKESLVEIATVAIPEQNNVERKMKRLFVSELFSKTIPS
jgi:20S proteasome alpha/beta subunit